MTQESLIWQGNSNLGGIGDCGPYSDSDWQRMYKTHMGVGADSANRGVMRDVGSELQITANSPTASNVLVTSGAAFVAGIPYYNDNTETLTITANASGSTRNDIIILRADYVAQTVRLAVLQGIPAAGLPSLTQSVGTIYEIPLAYLTLASGFASVTASMITDYREYMNIPDAVGYLVTNASGSTLEIGTAVVPTGTQSITRSTTLGTSAAGVIESRSANGAQCRIITQGIFPVLCAASVSVGDLLGIGTTTGQATAGAPFPFARVLVANTGAGTTALCYIDIEVAPIVPACSAYHNTTQNVGAGATIACSLNSEHYDNAGMHSNVTNTSRITFPVAGIYGFTAFLQVSTGSGIYGTIRLNGSTLITVLGKDGDYAGLNGGSEYIFAAGDYIEVMAVNISGGTITISVATLKVSFRSK
jgi:hypothetical protein